MAVRKVSTKIVKSLDEEAEPVLLLGQSRLREVVETSIDPVAGARDITTTLGDGAVKGGDDSNVHTSNVAIPGMNEEPAGADNLDVAVNEDGTYTFAVSDFGFTDSDGNAFAGVAIITLPATGTLFHNGVAITSAPMGGYFVSAADLAANLFTYVPALNGSGDDYASFTFAVRDDGGTDNGGVDQDSSPNTFSFDVAAVNDDPTIGNLNGDTASFTEGGSLFSAMLDAGLDTTISDVDSANFAGGSLRVQITNAVAGQDFIYFNNSNPAFGLTFSGNTLSYNGVAFATFTAPSADRTFTFDADATPQAVQSLVRSLAYFNSNTANPSTVTRTVNLTLNDGSGGATTVSTSVDIVAVNDAPVNAVPGAQNGTEDSNLLFSTGNGNAISVSDVDAATLTVTLTVANGLLTLSGTAGLSFSVGDGTNDATMTFTGTAAAINTALDGLIYRGDLNYSGGDTLTVTTNDNGLTGADPGASGGATDEQDVDTVTITLAADGVISGDGNDNTVSGTAGADVYDLSQGGDDTVSGLGGDDGFYFGAAYTSADTVDGGAGSLDQIGLQGNYGSTTLGAMTGVEQLVLLAGSDTRFGDPGTNFYDYVLVATDATLAAGQQLVVQANALRVGEDLTFDGSAETDGSFLIYGGSGVDTLTGGAGDDGFFFGEGRWGASDVVNGGTGTMDQLGLQGNFNITFGAGQLIGLEFVVLMSAVDTRFGQGGGTADYSLTMNNANVAAGQTLVVSANTLQTGESLSFNGSAETDGRFDIFSGDGNDVLTGGSGADVIYGGGRGDTLTGGAGNDIFAYRSVTDSNSTERDGIQDFNAGDRIDLSLIDANINAGGNQDFTFVGANAFSGTAGELRYENISLGGPIWLVQGDVNGDGVSDLEIVLVISPADPITAADFIGVNPAFAPVVGGKKYEGSQVMPAEAGATAPDESRPTEPFTRPHDDRSLTLGQDGFLSFGPADGDDDFLVLAGDFADQPLVLPGQPDGLHSDLEAFEGGRGPEFPSSGDVALTLADDSQAFSDNWMDVSGLYNWC